MKNKKQKKQQMIYFCDHGANNKVQRDNLKQVLCQVVCYYSVND